MSVSELRHEEMSLCQGGLARGTRPGNCEVCAARWWLNMVENWQRKEVVVVVVVIGGTDD